MSPVQSLSATILNILTEFGDKKLKKALKPVNPDHGENKEREELMTLLDNEIYSFRPEFEITEKRPISLECDVVKFQNKKEKWVAFVGLLDGYPYEIFTGVLDDEDGTKRYDFTFVNRRGYKTTIEGLSERFNKEYWNYAKLISGVLRYRMPLTNVVKLISSLQLENENINTWANGVARALKKYTNDGEVISEDLNLNADLRNAEIDAE